MNGPVRSVWTSEDEARLRELSERKDRIMKANADNVRAALNAAGVDVSDVDLQRIVSNAADIHDALGAFVEPDKRSR